MTYVNAQSKVAVEIPSAPTALKYNNHFIQNVGGFLHVTQEHNCSLTPLNTGVVVRFEKYVGTVAAIRGAWYIVFDKLCIKVPKSGLIISTGNENTNVLPGSNAQYKSRWYSGSKVSTAGIKLTMTNLIGAVSSADGNNLTDVLLSTFPNDIDTIIQFVMGLKYGPAYVTPTAQCVRKALDSGAELETTMRFKRAGGYVFTDKGRVYAIQPPKSYKTVDVAVKPMATLPDNVTWSSRTKLNFKLPAQQNKDGSVRRISQHTLIQQASTSRPPKFIQSLTVADACEPVDAQQLIWGVHSSCLLQAVALLTRAGEKQQPNFLKTMGIRNKRDLRFVKTLVNPAKPTDRMPRVVLLGVVRGHPYKDARLEYTSASASLPFRPGRLFRAPKTKADYSSNATLWNAELKVWKDMQAPAGDYEEPLVLLEPSRGQKWHSNAHLRKWKVGSKPAFEYVWEPKIDGWRVLLHWTGKDLLWASNTGRNITGLVPKKFRQQIFTACQSCQAFILECELVAGEIENGSEAEVECITGDRFAKMPRRTRASQVKSVSSQHTLFAMDCLCYNNEDISNKAYADRKVCASKLIFQDMENARIQAIPCHKVRSTDGVIDKEFINSMFAKMLEAGIEGIVIKATSLAYGHKYAVLKPIYYITHPKMLHGLDPWELFQCYASTVYMGYIEVGRAPWFYPIFGVKTETSKLRKSHPWYGYTPVHIEGYATAYSMMKHVRGYDQTHVVESYYTQTPWFSQGLVSRTGARRYLHNVNATSPCVTLVAEMAYERKNKKGWAFPIRLYLARSIPQTQKLFPVDTVKTLTERLKPFLQLEP